MTAMILLGGLTGLLGFVSPGSRNFTAHLRYWMILTAAAGITSIMAAGDPTPRAATIALFVGFPAGYILSSIVTLVRYGFGHGGGGGGGDDDPTPDWPQDPEDHTADADPVVVDVPASRGTEDLMAQFERETADVPAYAENERS